MPLYLVKCPKHGEAEAFAGINEMNVPCGTCGKPTNRLISVSGCFTANETTNWLPSVLEIVDKDSKKPHIVEFLKNPTRSNYKTWMKKEGLRHMEKGEETIKREDVDLSQVHREVWAKHRARHALEVRG